MARFIIPSNSLCLASVDWNYYLYVVIDQYGHEVNSFNTESEARKFRIHVLKDVDPNALLFIQRLQNSSVLLK